MGRSKFDKEQVRERYCYGCGKGPLIITSDHGDPYDRDGTHIKLAPGIEVPVCGVYRSYYGECDPRTPCRRKATEKASCCPGCGDGWDAERNQPTYGDITPGRICEGCQRTLQEARERRKHADSTDVKWYSIDGSALFSESMLGHYYVTKDDEAEMAMANVFARMMAGHRIALAGESPGPGEHGGHITYKRIEPGSTAKSVRASSHYDDNRHHSRDPIVELTDDQVAAFCEVAEHIQAAIQRAFKAGAREGRSVLHSLASGEMTVADFNEKSGKYDEDEHVDASG